jgi:hypothetical protein
MRGLKINKQAKRPDTPLAETPKPIKVTYDRLSMAREYTNQAEGRPSNTPATKKDSMDFRAGFKKGINNKDFTAKEEPYGKNEYQKMGVWEGKNAIKKSKSKK